MRPLKGNGRREQFSSSRPFYWIFRLLVDLAPTDQRGYIFEHLNFIAGHANNWDALNRIDLLFTTGTSLRTSTASDCIGVSDHSLEVHSRIASIFAERLANDFCLILEAGRVGDTNGEDQRVVEIPSKCALHAPTRQGAIHKRTRLDEAIAEKLRVATDGLKVPERFRNSSTEIRYQTVVGRIRRFLRECKKIVANLQNSKEKVFDLNQLSDDRWEAMKKSELSESILYPQPEPVDIATAEQMEPLHAFLRNSTSGLSGPEITFERGTLLEDGRLDLCKQVIGPIGVNPLFESLYGDERGLVKHLLLGNNVAGDDLGQAVAKFIRSGQSKLTTWYIAGNKLTVKGVLPVCQALTRDNFVQQLWLKRNPLLLPGADAVASMLRTNTYLQVLDLTNTDLLDQGAASVMEALTVNPLSNLRYLYLDTNGIGLEGVKAISDYFKTTQNRCLLGLGLGCNPVGDAGVKELVSGLETYQSLKRLTLSSCGIGPGGAQLLTSLITGTQIRYLDLGLMKSTAAVGETPNRVKAEGLIALSKALSDERCKLEGLVLSSNTIHQNGFDALEEALVSNPNSCLRHFAARQPGIPLNELTHERIALIIRANQDDWNTIHGSGDTDDFVNPAHLQNIQSVYRVGDTYKPSS